MKPEKIVIIGAGGCGREVVDIFEDCNKREMQYDLLGYIVDPEFVTGSNQIVQNLPILGGFDWLKDHSGEVQVICGVGNPDLRRGLVERVNAIGVCYCNAIHPSVISTAHITLGQGVVIAAGCILTNNIRIGNHVHINVGCTVSHDTIMEDFVTLSPSTHIAGGVLLKEGAFIGIGANVIQRKRIGAWSTIGAGTTVIAAVPANSTVVGSPGRVVKTKSVGWHLK